VFVQLGKDLATSSFWETDRFELPNMKVVAEDLATLDWPNETSMLVQGDHRSICRFPSLEEKRYRAVWVNLQKLASGAIDNSKLCSSNICSLISLSPYSFL